MNDTQTNASPTLKLYGYWRSSAAYRVRIALNLKGLAFENLPVHLAKDGGQQHAADYKALNPQELSGPLGVEDEAKQQWIKHWIATGLAGVEQGLAAFDGKLSLGRRPGYLEACLVPQVYNARRFSCDLSAYPRILQMTEQCETLEAFAKAAPEVQPDAQ